MRSLLNLYLHMLRREEVIYSKEDVKRVLATIEISCAHYEVEQEGGEEISEHGEWIKVADLERALDEIEKAL